ncbi:(2Fe-2S)-binding protein [Thiolinea disciformis]|uniref:(2Fe-2S)-binding protein n=1 Tax=Thiolinea disciformis TaxID=125614 RepID=UPI0003687BCB|nr:(2Fe-2S)-binding protein [Thiolinea disciformis]
MYICICHSVSDKAIRAAVQQGYTSLEAIQDILKVGTCCGRCKPEAQDVISHCLNETSCTNFHLAQEVVL